jgi:RIO-like serine/threonine protein kinase
MHGDLNLHNFLLHDDGKLILCDFAGFGLDKLLPNINADIRYLNLLFNSDYPSERDDIFVLNTVFYEFDRGERFFDGKTIRRLNNIYVINNFLTYF